MGTEPLPPKTKQKKQAQERVRIPPHQHPQRAEILRLYCDEGLTITAIRYRLHIGKETAAAVLRACGVEIRPHTHYQRKQRESANSVS